MSSRDFENRDIGKLAPPDRLLFLLKTRGPQTAGDLGAKLQITPEAARQQLLRLSDEGLVCAKSEVGAAFMADCRARVHRTLRRNAV